MPRPDVSVVICAYSDERRQTLLAGVESLRRQTRPPLEVIVVVDHNRELLEWVARCLQDVTAVANRDRPGLAAARNAGVDSAAGGVVAFLDDDAYAAPDWLERLSRAYRDPRVLGAGGAVVPQFEAGRPRWLPEEFDWAVGCSYRGLPSAPAPVRNLIGCNMSFRRDALKRAGGFAPGMGRIEADGTGCEETELCIRLGQLHPEGRFFYDPEARVGHHVPRARASLAYFLSRCHAEGVSKAAVAQRCGLSDALQSERAYTRRTLPAGIHAGIVASVRGDPGGLARAGAIVLGLLFTAAGFATSSRAPTGQVMSTRVPLGAR